MSIVPSEIEIDYDSEQGHEIAHISGFVASVLLALLAAGFVVVGYLSFQQLRGEKLVGADALPVIETAQAPEAIDDPQKAPLSQANDVASAGAEAPTAPSSEDPGPVDTGPVDTGPLVPSPDIPRPLEQSPLAPSPAAPTLADPPEATLPETEANGGSPDGLEENNTGDETDIASPMPGAAITGPAVAPTIKPRISRTPTLTIDQSILDAITDTPDVRVPAEPPVIATPDAPAPPAHSDSTGVVDALSGSHLVQVGSYRSEEEAIAGWQRIDRRFPAALSGKTYHIEMADLGDRGVFYRLRIGPFGDGDAARAHCETLTQGGQACYAVRH